MLIDKNNDEEFVPENKMFLKISIKMNKNLDYMELKKILLMLRSNDWNENLLMKQNQNVDEVNKILRFE